MNFKEFLKKTNKKVKKLEEKAKNPFIESSFAYNPFINAFEQTYIWVERNSRHKF